MIKSLHLELVLLLTIGMSAQLARAELIIDSEVWNDAPNIYSTFDFDFDTFFPGGFWVTPWHGGVPGGKDHRFIIVTSLFPYLKEAKIFLVSEYEDGTAAVRIHKPVKIVMAEVYTQDLVWSLEKANGYEFQKYDYSEIKDKETFLQAIMTDIWSEDKAPAIKQLKSAPKDQTD